MRMFYTLADYPHDMVEIECAKCGRPGRLRTTRLLEQHGPDIKLPDLLGEIAQCPNWDNMNEGCQAQYPPSSQIDRQVAGELRATSALQSKQAP